MIPTTQQQTLAKDFFTFCETHRLKNATLSIPDEIAGYEFIIHSNNFDEKTVLLQENRQERCGLDFREAPSSP